MLRALLLVAVVGAILGVFRHLNAPRLSGIERIAAARQAAAQEVTSSPVATSTTLPPTPTETPAVSIDTSTAVSTATETPTPPATETPTPTPPPTETPSGTATPPSTPTPEATEVVIGSAGGSITSVDGNVSIAFPANATNESLLVRISTAPEGLAAIPDTPVVDLWEFDAFAINRGNAEVHQFNAALTIDIQFTQDEFFGLSGLRYWSYDESLAQWVESPTTYLGSLHWRVELDHFSTQAASSDAAITMPTYLDASQVQLQTGAASFSLPIIAAPGLNGVQPQLQLTYSSGRVDETDNGGYGAYAVPAGWAGVGWDLTAPSITRSGPRYFLNLDGYGTELVRANDQATEWWGRDDQFLKITTTTSGSGDNQQEVTWTLRDQAGTTYVFGGTSDSRRDYSVPFGGSQVNYQWDLSSTTDIHNNAVTYSYYQLKGMKAIWGNFPFQSVVSAYLSSIAYPGGRVDFVRKSGTGWAEASYRFVDFTLGNPPVALPMRIDARACSVPSEQVVMESQALDSVIVKTYDAGTYQTVRTYKFNLTSTPADVAVCDSSGLRLDSVDVLGRDGGNLANIAFQYEAKTTNAWYGVACLYAYPRQVSNLRLTTVTTSFGGQTAFQYQTTPIVPNYCGTGANPPQFSRFLADRLTRKAGSSWTVENFDVVTNYAYAEGPYWVDDGPNGSGNYAPRRIVFRGYRKVTETDAAGERSVHRFYTGNEAEPGAAELAGRQRIAERYGNEDTGSEAGDLLWSRSETTYTSSTTHMSVPTGTSTATPTAVAYFNRASSVVAAGKDGLQSRTSYFHNTTWGYVTQTYEDGSANDPGNADCRITNYSVTVNDGVAAGSNYLVLPQKQQAGTCPATQPSTPGATPVPMSAVMAETQYFYDGLGYGTATPVKGNLTAMRRTRSVAAPTTDNDKYVYTYNSYYTNGQLKESSVPLYGPAAATWTPVAGPEGAVPSSKGRALMKYDALSVAGAAADTGRFPASTTVYVYDEPGMPAPTPLPTQETLYQYDRVLGVMTRQQSNGAMITKNLYDQYGRPTGVWRSGGDGGTEAAPIPGTEYSYAWGDAGGVNSTTVKRRLTNGASVTMDGVQCFDGLGRQRQTLGAYGSGFALSVQLYNARGMVENSRLVTNPTLACAPAETGQASGPNNYVQYDPLGQPLTQTNSPPGAPVACSPSCARVERNGRTTITYDQLNHKTETEVDGLGRVLRETKFTGAGPNYTRYSEVTYGYDVLDNLTGVYEWSSAPPKTTTMTYDALGRKLSMTDPDMSGYSTGTTRIPWTYAYDAAGNLTQQVDARGVTTTLKYDSLDRLRQKSYAGPGGITGVGNTITYQYDLWSSPCSAAHTPGTIGRLAKTITANGSTTYCYDVRGRELKRSIYIAAADIGCTTWSRTYAISKTYDAGDRLKSVLYPSQSPETVSYGFKDTATGGGKLDTVTSSLGPQYVSGATYHETGAPATVTFGNGYTTTYARDTRYRLQSIVTGNGTTTPQNLAYTFDEAGNVSGINDSVAGENVTYTYDDLNRILSMSINGGPAAASYTYEQPSPGSGLATLGRMTSKMEGGLTLGFTFNDEHVHAPVTAGAMTLTYDKNGNQTYVSSDPAAGNTFDVENRIATMSAFPNLDSYLYDAGGEMTRRSTWNIFQPQGTYDAKETFAGGIYQEQSTGCGAAATYTKYYMAFGRVIASRDRVAIGQPGSVTYFLADHLGSTTTTVTGGVATHAKYWPFGAWRSGTPQQRGYTGQQREANSPIGAYYYHARFYSTTLGHFMSADPITVDGLNRYAYVRWNPLRLTDPTGYDAVCFITCTGSGSDLVVDNGVCGAQCAGALQYIHAQQAISAAFAVGGSPAGCLACAEWEALAGSGVSPWTWLVAAASGDPATWLRAPHHIQTFQAIWALDSAKYPAVANNVAKALADGAPVVLTIDRSPGAADARGRAAVRGTQPAPGLHRDEYPPKMFAEGGAGARLEYVPPSQNLGAGASMGNQLRQYPTGTQVRVVIRTGDVAPAFNVGAAARPNVALGGNIVLNLVVLTDMLLNILSPPQSSCPPTC